MNINSYETSNHKTIGGFFEIELGSNTDSYHPNTLALTSGRACLNLILSITKAKKVYLPYYICDAALIPLKLLGIAYEFYALDEKLKPRQLINLQPNEYFLFVNYFGLATNTVNELYEHYRNRLIIDNTHAFFERNYKDCWSFNSARKFFGVPDGAYLYTPFSFSYTLKHNTNIHYSHLIERLQNNPLAYEAFKINEEKISTEILGISLLSEKLLAGINYSEVIARRKSNFAIYAEALSKQNKLSISMDNNIVPFCYPLWHETKIQSSLLNKYGIFIPTFWQNTIDRNLSDFEFEKELTTQLLPLPIDHRYNADDCKRVIDAILKLC